MGHETLPATPLISFPSAKECQFAAAGHSTPSRSKAKARAGTAPVHEDEVIHATFFHPDGTEQSQRMASYRSQRECFTG